MDNTLYKTDKPLTTLEILNYYLNMFKDKVVSNLIDIKHYEYIKSVKPDYATMTQTGVRMSVDDLIESHKSGVQYARENVVRIEEMIKAEEAGEFGNLITDAAIGRMTIAEVLKENNDDEGTGTKA